MHSLQARISVLTLTCIALVVLPFCVLTYAKIVEEVDELSDARLAQNARVIEVLSEHVDATESASAPPREIDSWLRPSGDGAPAQGHPYETEVGFQYWKNASELRLTTRDLRNLRFDAAPAGFADIRKEGKRWRVFTLTGRSGFVRAAERYDSRREIARDLLLQNAAPMLIGLPLLAFLVSWAVRRGLRPLTDITRRLESRRPDAVGPLSTQGAPKEIEPLLGALNGLLDRLRATLDGERQFTANAAHELRTPLAGALVHLDNAQASVDAADRANAIGEARGGLERLARIVNQMLDLARWDTSARMPAFGPVDLGQCVDDELMTLDLAVVEKDVEIARSFDSQARIVQGWEPGLRTLVRNLLDNALRYGFEHGRIDIEIGLRDGRTLLAISDSGPGILPSQREAMLERFHRGGDASKEGSGLGLSIVTRVAQVHGASVDLGDPADRHGLRVEVLFPDDVPARGARDEG
jgi:two-component system sensor histidine kinase QseC